MCGWAGTLVGVPRPVHVFSINHQSPILIVEISTKMGFEARRHAAVAVVSNVSVVSVVAILKSRLAYVSVVFGLMPRILSCFLYSTSEGFRYRRCAMP